MQLIASRTLSQPDDSFLAPCKVREVLFRSDHGGFILYRLSRAATSGADERLIRLNSRQALIWINEGVGTERLSDSLENQD